MDRFHHELRVLTEQLLVMGGLVEARVRDVVTALLDRREDLAALVASGDTDVNNLELHVDDLTLRLLALQHPVASDLRQVRSAIKVNTDLERIGDQAVNIAHAAIPLISLPALAATPDVRQLADISIGMLHDSVTALATHDLALARSVLIRDDEADGMRDTIVRLLVRQMTDDAGTVERALGLLVISRALERIADHATNVAEEIIFLVGGRVVRHNHIVV